MGILTYDNKQFLMDGKPFRIISGAIHYFRIHPDYWEDRLTKLRACEVVTGINLVINDNSAAHACSQGYHNGIVRSLSRSRNSLAPCGGVCIVFHRNASHRESLTQQGCYGEFTERQIVCVFYHAVVVVCHTGRSDTNRLNLRHIHACGPAHLAAQRRDVVNYLLAGALRQSGSALLYDNIIFYN